MQTTVIYNIKITKKIFNMKYSLESHISPLSRIKTFQTGLK